MKILTKELLKTYTYTTSNGNREGVKSVKINGREYAKFGTFQAVTLVGNLYNIYDYGVKRSKKMLMIGVARQHPRDRKIDKEYAYEVAHTNAMLDPCMVIEVGDNCTQFNFRQFAKNYIDTLELEFVKTNQEIEEDDLINAIDQIEFEELDEDDTNIPDIF